MRNFPIRTKLISAFSIVALVASTHFFIQDIYTDRLEQTKSYVQEIEELKSLILQGVKAQSDFLNNDLIDDRFYLNGHSENIFRYEHIYKQGGHKFSELAAHPIAEREEIKGRIKKLKSEIVEIDKDFNELVLSSLQAGFHDFGTTGEMRNYAHRLEDEFSELIPKSVILSLRRHEKDFIIRKQEKYRNKFNILYREIRGELEKSESEQRMACRVTLDNYHDAFNRMCELILKNGINMKGGLRGDINQSIGETLLQVEELLHEVNRISIVELRNLKTLFYLSIALTTIITVLVVFYLSRVMSRSIGQLSAGVQRFVKSDFTEELDIPKLNERKDELGALYGSFKKLAEEVTVHFKNYRFNAEAKHKEILAKNEKIGEQKAKLESQKNLLSQRNKSLMDSIIYARRIQSAILPNESALTDLIGGHILMFKPKDIVSGDFYWVERTEDSLYFAVADCTGHGVPGALMSILGYNHLNQAIREIGLQEPGEILEYLNEGISGLLNPLDAEDGVKDGMDIILCRWKFEEEKLEYAGANRPLVVVENRGIRTLNTDRVAVGWMYKNQKDGKRFTTGKISLQPDSMIFLFSDGYSDQFGGDRNKKLKVREFKNLLASTAELHPEEGKKQLMRSFRSWKGKNEQIDDICILGVSSNELFKLSQPRSNSLEKRDCIPIRLIDHG